MMQKAQNVPRYLPRQDKKRPIQLKCQYSKNYLKCLSTTYVSRDSLKRGQEA